MFIREQSLDYGRNVRRFYADYQEAQAWQRTVSGKGTEWWLNELLKNTDQYCIYRYSRCNVALDGVIRYEKPTCSIVVEKPCKADENDDVCIKYAASKFYHVVKEGFPNRTQVACG